MSESSDESGADAPWKTVEYQHRKSKKAARKAPAETQPPKVDLVKEAEKHLTMEEKQRILERKRAEDNAQSQEETETSREEGPSNLKGKGVDPCNWGDVDLDEAEVDLEAQREALSTWARTHKWSKAAPQEENNNNIDQEVDEGVNDPVTAAVKATKKRMTQLFEMQIHQLRKELESKTHPPKKQVKVKSPKRDKTRKLAKEPKSTNPVREMLDRTGSKPSKHRERSTPPAMDAVAQIAPKSYLGRAFEQIKPKGKKFSKGRKKRVSSDSPESSSSSLSTSTSSSSSSSADLSSSLSSDESGDTLSSSSTKRRKCLSKKRKHSKKRKSTQRRTTLKPIPPSEYDGTDNP
ncbi:hypothetical protein F4604DRAFT_1915867 [Suillus subluteus]|nr:hypothetical protein F4604DRAFT_1915867 [Suillus subluteus]